MSPRRTRFGVFEGRRARRTRPGGAPARGLGAAFPAARGWGLNRRASGGTSGSGRPQSGNRPPFPKPPPRHPLPAQGHPRKSLAPPRPVDSTHPQSRVATRVIGGRARPWRRRRPTHPASTTRRSSRRAPRPSRGMAGSTSRSSAPRAWASRRWSTPCSAATGRRSDAACRSRAACTSTATTRSASGTSMVRDRLAGPARPAAAQPPRRHRRSPRRPPDLGRLVLRAGRRRQVHPGRHRDDPRARRAGAAGDPVLTKVDWIKNPITRSPGRREGPGGVRRLAQQSGRSEHRRAAAHPVPAGHPHLHPRQERKGKGHGLGDLVTETLELAPERDKDAFRIAQRLNLPWKREMARPIIAAAAQRHGSGDGSASRL